MVGIFRDLVLPSVAHSHEVREPWRGLGFLLAGALGRTRKYSPLQAISFLESLRVRRRSAVCRYTVESPHTMVPARFHRGAVRGRSPRNPDPSVSRLDRRLPAGARDRPEPAG